MTLLLVSLALPMAVQGRIYVSATDPSCGGQAPCFTTIQAGIDAATPGEEVSVAAGIYTGVAAVDLAGDIYHQVVMITESVVLQGGYTTSDWTEPDPRLNETTIDAENAGRGITIVGDSNQTVTVAGFTIINGDYSGLGNADGEFNVCRRTSSDCAGGLLARFVRVHIEDCLFEDNIASTTRNFSDGGGAVLWRTADGSTVRFTDFEENQAPAPDGSGGGLWLVEVNDTLVELTTFDQNIAAVRGGGLGVNSPFGTVTLNKVLFLGNDADGIGGGGGAWVNLDRAGQGLVVDQAVFIRNQSNTQGTGLFVRKVGIFDSIIDLDNLLFEGNEPEVSSDINSVIGLSGEFGSLTANLRHITIFDQFDAAAIRAQTDNTGTLTVDVVNTLIQDTDSGFRVSELGGELVLDHTNTLSHDVSTLEVVDSGTPTITGTGGLAGDPMLDSNGSLTEGSPAIDAGVDSGVGRDIDDDPRPAGSAHDIGADEYIEIFEDDFESGDVSAWTSSSP